MLVRMPHRSYNGDAMRLARPSVYASECAQASSGAEKHATTSALYQQKELGARQSCRAAVHEAIRLIFRKLWVQTCRERSPVPVRCAVAARVLHRRLTRVPLDGRLCILSVAAIFP